MLLNQNNSFIVRDKGREKELYIIPQHALNESKPFTVPKIVPSEPYR